MSTQRYYLSLLGDSFERKGLRVNDRVTLIPAMGRKKNFQLNRKSYRIYSHAEETVIIDSHCIYLPKMIDQNFEFELKLASPLEGSQDEERLRYLLKSASNTPFRHNGSLVYEAFLERGDLVTIGYNKFKFEFHYGNAKNDEVVLDKRLVESQLNILIEGETGTGKSTLAKQIHDRSFRNGSFVHLNLSAFSSGLIESELFGHNKGSFTGAITDKIGAFSQAHLGTLFIDEIDSLSLDMQTKLLLFLDDGVIRPVGSSLEKKVDVRLIVASGSSLETKVKQGQMRKDFFYRISSGVKLSLPSLKNNKMKIKQLVQDFMRRNDVYFENKLIQFYLNCPWPGNIRQLEGHLQKKCVLAKGNKIYLDEMDESLLTISDEVVEELDNLVSMKLLKKNYAKKVLIKFDGNVNQAAKAIGITPKTMKTLAS